MGYPGFNIKKDGTLSFNDSRGRLWTVENESDAGEEDLMVKAKTLYDEIESSGVTRLWLIIKSKV